MQAGALFSGELGGVHSRRSFLSGHWAFVDRLDMQGLGFGRAEAAETGRPGYDPAGFAQAVLDFAGVLTEGTVALGSNLKNELDDPLEEGKSGYINRCVLDIQFSFDREQ